MCVLWSDLADALAEILFDDALDCATDKGRIISRAALQEAARTRAGTCPACDGLSPGITIDGETIMHCAVCNETGKVTPEQNERFWEAVRERQNRRRSQE
jgi:hypothetical protein